MDEEGGMDPNDVQWRRKMACRRLRLRPFDGNYVLDEFDWDRLQKTAITWFTNDLTRVDDVILDKALDFPERHLSISTNFDLAMIRETANLFGSGELSKEECSEYIWYVFKVTLEVEESVGHKIMEESPGFFKLMFDHETLPLTG